jgi:hypothetical protein
MLAAGIAACSQPSSSTQSANGADKSAPQEAAKEPAAPAPAASTIPGNSYASLAMLPDFSGPWTLDTSKDAAHSNDPVPFAAPYAAKLAKVRQIVASGKPVPSVQSRCVPNGMPTMMYIQGAAYQFLLTPGRFTVITDTHDVRRAFTDGREHTSDPDNSYGGEGVAHWEGTTLVVDTLGLLPELPIVPGVAGAGKVHVVERIHLVSDDKLQVDTSVTDDSLTAPYTYTHSYTRHRGANMEENICLPEPDLKL